MLIQNILPKISDVLKSKKIVTHMTEIFHTVYKRLLYKLLRKKSVMEETEAEKELS